MNKKLVVLALAAAVAAPAAMANETVLYGKAHVSIQKNDNVSGSSEDNYTVDSNASRLGVKGSEDLGDGLKAIFGYEMGYNITDTNEGDSPITARNAYVGLSGGFGTFLVGRHDTPAKVAFHAAGTDFLGDSIVDMNNVAGTGTFTERRLDNAIAYISPSFSGFTVAGAVVPGEGTNGYSSDLANAASVGAMYSGNGLKASVGYEVADLSFLDNLGVTPTPVNKEKMWQAGLSYTFGDFTLGGNYQNTKDVNGQDGDRTAWGLAGKANFGNNYVVVNYANNDSDASVESQMASADGYGLAVGHNFSKRTQVYVAYHKTDYDDDAMEDPSSYALGMIHSF
jgi:predicted porin